MLQKITAYFFTCIFLFPFVAQAQNEQEVKALISKYTEFQKAGKYQEAIPLAQRILEVTEKIYGRENTYTASQLNALGLLYYDMGDYAKAEPIFKEALQIKEKILGPDHHETSTIRKNLSELYNATGNYSAAIPLYEQALLVSERNLGTDHPDTITILNNLASLYQYMGFYAKAEPLFKRALLITEKVYGQGHINTATHLNNLGLLYYDMGDYAKAEPLYKRGLAITEKVLGPDHLDIVINLNNLAELYRAMGNYAQAEPLHKRALQITEKTLGPDHPDIATNLNNLAELYRAMGNYAQAEPFYKRSLQIKEKTLGLDHPDPETATILNNLSVLYQAMGDYAKAEPLCIRALQIREKFLGQDHPDTAGSLNTLAELYTIMGDYVKAEPLYNRSLSICEKFLGQEHPNTASSLNNLAGLYETRGDYYKAEALYKRALRIREKVLGAEHPDTASTLETLAGMYRIMGDYEKAEPLYKRALLIREKVLGSDHPDTASSLRALAQLYQNTGDYEKVELLEKRALQICEKTLGPNHPNTAASLNNLGLLFETIGDYAKAEPLYKRALWICVQSFGQDHRHTATTIRNLAGLYDKIGDYAKAESLYEKALQIEEKVLGIDNPNIISTLNNLANLYQHTEDYAKAEPLYKRALLICKKFFGLGNTSTIDTMNNLASCYVVQGQLAKAEEILKKTNDTSGWVHYYLFSKDFKKAENIFHQNNFPSPTIDNQIEKSIFLGLVYEGQGKYARAKTTFTKAISLIEKQYTTLTFVQRQTYFSGKIASLRRIEPYEGMVRILLKEQSPSCKAEALWYAEWAKSRILQEMLAARELGGATVEDRRIFEKDREFQKQLIVLNKRIEVMTGMGERAPRGEVQKFEAELESARAKYEDFLKDVKFKNAEIASLIGTLPPTVQEVQPLLDNDVTVLAYYTGQDKTWAWLVTKSDVKVFELNTADKELNAKAIRSNVDGLLAMNVSTRGRRPTPIITLSTDNSSTIETDQAQRELNRQEFNRRSQELYSQLLAPVVGEIKTNKLVIVPHGILHRIPFACLTDGTKALVERFDVSVAPSVNAIEFIVKKRKANSGRLTAFANPANDKMPLPYTEAEVLEIKPLFKQTEIFNRAEATEGAAKQRTSASDVIHFACHGEFNDRQPLQSGLLLAADADNDGILQMHEIYGMNLRQANLVTLSACETALCKIQGGEDWAGMSRGFIYAGTPSILATLWSVDDKSTAILMKNFYTNWVTKGMSKPAALRQAQLDLKAIPEYSHPYFWAPFVMIGDWR